MVGDVNAAVQRLLLEHGQIDPGDVDVRFDAPRRDWVASLTRPTLSCFLFDMQENTELRHTNLESTRMNGHATYRVPPRRFDLRYMVSALTTDVEDEHLLLWRALVTLLKHPRLPDDVLSAPLRALDPPLTTQVSPPDDGAPLLELWSGLEAAPRPALLYVVTAPVELDFTRLAPLVLTRTARYARVGRDAPADERRQIGGVVRDAGGQPLANARVAIDGGASEGALTAADGTFRMAAVPAGPITLRVTGVAAAPKLVRVTVPSDSYDIVID